MFTLLRKNIKTLLLRNKLIIALFAVCMFISSQALFYVSGEVFSELSRLEDVNEKCRSFFVYPIDNDNFSYCKTRLDELSKSSEVENIRLAIDESVYAYYNKRDYEVHYGKGFSESGEPQVVIGTTLEQTLEVGDVFQIAGKYYSVVGKRVMHTFHEINYNSIEDDDIIQEIQVLYKKKPNEREIARLEGILIDIFPNSQIVPPAEYNAIEFFSDKNKLIMLIAIAVMSVLNISFLYRYLLTKRKNTYAIYQICGCSKSKGSLIFILEAFILTVIPFLCGALFYKLVLEELILNDFVLLYRLTLKQLGIVALLYLIILLAVFFPLIRKYSKKTPKELKTSYGIG